MIEYFEFGSERLGEVIKIYEECEWKSYLGKNDRLKKAFDNSLFTVYDVNIRFQTLSRFCTPTQ